MDTVEKVLQTYIDAGKPLKATEVSELSGLDKKDVDKAIKTLKDQDKIESPKRCYYQAK